MSTQGRHVNALLVGDRRLIRVGKSCYSEGPTGPETGERYLRWFDKVTVAGRYGTMDGPDTSRLNRIDAEGLSVVQLPNLSGLGAQLKNLRTVRDALRAQINEHDAIIARLPTQLGLTALHLGLAARKPVAVDLGGCAYDGLWAHGSLRGRLYAPIAYRRLRRAVSQCHWVSYVTQEYLQCRYPAAPGARTIGCSNVELPNVTDDVLKMRAERTKSSPGPVILGTIGSLHGRFKGIQHAISALGRIRTDLSPFEYRVLGGGDPSPWRELAERNGLADKVYFDGALPAGQPVFDWLDNIDVYLHPSLREGVPRAVIEAMSRGCPVVASNVAGTPELLPQEVLHNPGDVDRLCELLPRFFDRSVWLAHSRHNFERSKQYSAERLLAVRDDFWGAFAERSCKRRADPGSIEP